MVKLLIFALATISVAWTAPSPSGYGAKVPLFGSFFGSDQQSTPYRSSYSSGLGGIHTSSVKGISSQAKNIGGFQSFNPSNGYGSHSGYSNYRDTPATNNKWNSGADSFLKLNIPVKSGYGHYSGSTFGAQSSDITNGGFKTGGYSTGLNFGGQESSAWGGKIKESFENGGTTTFNKEQNLKSIETKKASDSGVSIKTGIISIPDLKVEGENGGSWTVKTTELTGSSTYGKSGSGFNDKIEGGISGGFVAPASDEKATITLVSAGTGTGVSGGYKTGHDFKTNKEKSGVFSVTTKEVTADTNTATSGVEFGKKLVSENAKPVSIVVGGNAGSGGYKTGHDFKATGENGGSWTVKTTEVTGSSTYGKSGIGSNDKIEGGISGGFVAPASDEKATITLVSVGTGTGVSGGYKTGHDLKNSEEKSGVFSVTTKEVTADTNTATSGVEFGKKLVSENAKPVSLVVGGNAGSGGYKTGHDFKAAGENGGSLTVKTAEVTGSSTFGKSGIGSNDKIEGGISGGFVAPASDEKSTTTLVSGGTGTGVSGGYKTGHDLKTNEEKSGVWSVTTKEVTANTNTAASGIEFGKKLVSENAKPVSIVVGGNAGSGGYKTGHDFKAAGENGGSWTVKTAEVTGSSTFGKSGIGSNDKIEGGISGGFVAPASDEKATITLVSGGTGTGVSGGYKTGHDLKTNEEKSGVWSVTTKEVTANTNTAASGIEFGKKIVSENAKPVSIVVGGNAGSGGYETGHDFKATGENGGSWTVKTTEVTGSSTFGKSGIGSNDKIEGGISGGFVAPASDEKATITLVSGGTGTGVSGGYKTGHDLKTNEEKSGVWSVTTKEVTANTNTAASGIEFGKKLVSENANPVSIVVGGNAGSGGYKTGHDFKAAGENGGSWTVKTAEVTGSSTFGKSGIGSNDKIEGGISGGFVAPASDEKATITLVSGGTGTGVSGGYKTGHDLKTNEEKSGVWSVTTKEVTANTNTAASGIEFGKKIVSENAKPVSIVVGGNAGSGGYETGHDFKATGENGGSWTVKTTEVTGSSTFGKSGIGSNDKIEGGISGGFVAPASDEKATITLVSGGTGTGVSGGYKTGHDLKTNEEKSGVWSVTTKEVTANTNTAASGIEFGKKLVSENANPVSIVVGGNAGSGGYKTGHDFKAAGENGGSWTVKTAEVTGSSTFGKSGIGSNDKIEGGISGGFVAPASDEKATITLVSGGTGTGVSGGYKTGHDLKTNEEKSGVWSVTTKEVTANTNTAASGIEFGKKLVSENAKPVSIVVGGNAGSGGYKTGHDFKAAGENGGSWTVKTAEVTGSSTFGKSGIGSNDKIEGGISGGFVAPASDEKATITLVSGGTGTGVSGGYKTGHDLKTNEEKSGVWSVTTKEVTANTNTAASGIEFGKKLVSENAKPVSIVVGGNAGSGGYETGHDFKAAGENGGSWTVKTAEVTGSSTFGKSGIGSNDKIEGGISGGFVAPASDEKATITLVSGGTGTGVSGGYKTGHDLKTNEENNGVWSVTTKEVTSDTHNANSGIEFGKKLVSENAKPVSIVVGGNAGSGGYKTGHDFKATGENGGSWTVKTTEVTGSSTYGKSGSGFNDKIEGGISGGFVAPAADEKASITLVSGGTGTGVSGGYKTGHDLKNSEEKSGVFSVTTKEVTANTNTAASGIEFGKKLVSENAKPVSIVVGGNAGSGGYKTGHDFKATGENGGSWTVKTTEVTGSSTFGKSGIGSNDKIEGGISGGFVAPASDEKATITLVSGGTGTGVSGGYKTGHDLKTNEEKSGVWSVTTKEVTANTNTAASGIEFGKKLVSENAKPVSIVVGGNAGSGGYKTGHDFKATGENGGSWTVKTTEVTGSSTYGKSGSGFNDKIEGGISGGFVAPAADEKASITLVSGGTGTGVSGGYKTGHDLKNSEEKSGVFSVTTKEVTADTNTATSGVEFGKKLVSENAKPVSLVVGGNAGSGGYKTGHDFKATGENGGSWTVKTTEVTGSSTFGKSGIGSNDKIEGGISGGFVAPASDEKATITLVSKGTGTGVSGGYKTGHDLKTNEEKSGVWSVTTKEVTANTNTAASGIEFGKKLVSENEKPVSIVVGGNAGSGGYKTGHDFKATGENGGSWTVKTTEVTGSRTFGKSGTGSNDKIEGGISGGFVAPASDEKATITLVSGGSGTGVSGGYKTGHDLKTNEENNGVWSVTTKEVTSDTHNANSGIEFGKKLVSENAKPVSIVVGGIAENGGYKTGHDFKAAGENGGSWTVKTTEVTGSSTFGKSGSGFNDKIEGGISGGFVAPAADEKARITLVSGGTGTGVSGGYKTGHDLKTNEEKSGVWSVTTKEVTANTNTATSGIEFGKKLVSENAKPVSLVVGGNAGSGGYKTGHDFKAAGNNGGSWTVKTTEVTGSSTFGKSGIGLNDKTKGSSGGSGQRLKADGSLWSLLSKEVASSSGTAKSESGLSDQFVGGFKTGSGYNIGSDSKIITTKGYETGNDLNLAGKKSGYESISTKVVTGSSGAAQSFGENFVNQFLTGTARPVLLDSSFDKTGFTTGLKTGHDLKTDEKSSGFLTFKTKEVSNPVINVGFPIKSHGGYGGGYQRSYGSSNYGGHSGSHGIFGFLK